MAWTTQVSTGSCRAYTAWADSPETYPPLKGRGVPAPSAGDRPAPGTGPVPCTSRITFVAQEHAVRRLDAACVRAGGNTEDVSGAAAYEARTVAGQHLEPARIDPFLLKNRTLGVGPACAVLTKSA